MDETLKNRVVLFLSIAAAALVLCTCASCSSAYRHKLAHDKEIVARFESEEKMNKILRQEKAHQQYLKKLESQIEEEKTAHQKTKETLVQEQLSSQTLKEELRNREVSDGGST